MYWAFQFWKWYEWGITMIIYNSLNVVNLEPEQTLYVIRYSHDKYPDYVEVTYKKFIDDAIWYTNKKNIMKSISLTKSTFRLFSNIDEMARVLYDCFLKRRKDPNVVEEFKQIFLNSQENRPEMWI